jgi:hypothetical protein
LGDLENSALYRVGDIASEEAADVVATFADAIDGTDQRSHRTG